MMHCPERLNICIELGRAQGNMIIGVNDAVIIEDLKKVVDVVKV